MAADSKETGDALKTPLRKIRAPDMSEDEANGGSIDGEEDDEDEEDEEPRLRYASLTRGQGPLYRNGDAVSAFLVAGDKMVRFCSSQASLVAH